MAVHGNIKLTCKPHITRQPQREQPCTFPTAASAPGSPSNPELQRVILRDMWIQEGRKEATCQPHWFDGRRMQHRWLLSGKGGAVGMAQCWGRRHAAGRDTEPSGARASASLFERTKNGKGSSGPYKSVIFVNIPSLHTQNTTISMDKIFLKNYRDETQMYFTVINRSEYDFSSAHRLVVNFQFPFRLGGFSPMPRCDMTTATTKPGSSRWGR